MKAFGLCLATVAATFLLLLVGGTVNPTGSSLACPDWPTCYGSFFPEMKGGVVFEHSHRVLATIVGAMTVGLAFLIARERPENRALRRLGGVAVGLVVLQGVLGGVTVLLRLPRVVSMSHLAFSQFFFILLIHLAFRLARAAPTGPLPTSHPRGWALAAAIAVYLQILLGGWVRHSGAGLVCGGDFLTCHGEIFPSRGLEHLHMQHRFFGYLVFSLALVASARSLGTARRAGRRLAGGVAMAAPWMAAAQVGLGIATVLTFKGLIPVTAHLGGGVLLLACFVVIYHALGPLGGRSSSGPVPS